MESPRLKDFPNQPDRSGVRRHIDVVPTQRPHSHSDRVRCLVVVGTRPEAIKMVPVIRALADSKQLIPFVVTTGQHQDLVDPILALAGITPDHTLDVGSPGATVNDIVGRVVSGFEALLADLRGGPERRSRPRLFTAAEHPGTGYPALTLVHGDTSSAMAAAVASANAKIPVVHVEAGLRTGNLMSPFPEELNRHIISRIAAFHLAPTDRNEDNLAREGVDVRRIFVTGNTGLDALRWAAALPAQWPDAQLHQVDQHSGPVITVTAHRRENWGDGLAGIAAGITQIAQERPDALIVLPLHPNPRVRAQLQPVLGPLPNVLLTEPLDYVPFAKLLARSTLVITDSGGIQEEAPSLNTPVLVTRENSERPEGVEAGVARLVGTNPDRIAAAALGLLSNELDYQSMVHATNPYGDGQAAQRIQAALEYLIFGVAPPAAHSQTSEFGSGFSRRAVLQAAGFDDQEIDFTIAAISRARPELATQASRTMESV